MKPLAPLSPALPAPFVDWFAARGWTPRQHQLELVARAEAGESALLVAPTGAGKTLAGFLPSLIELTARGRRLPGLQRRGLHTLYISPLKALAIDVARNLKTPIEEMGLGVQNVPHFELLDSAQLGLALGIESVIHAAPTQGAAGETAVKRAERLARYIAN